MKLELAIAMLAIAALGACSEDLTPQPTGTAGATHSPAVGNAEAQEEAKEVAKTEEDDEDKKEEREKKPN